MSARDEILGRIRGALGERSSDAFAAGVRDLPARGVSSHGASGDALVARFIEKAKQASATCARIASIDDAPEAVRRYLLEEWLTESSVFVAPALASLPWPASWLAQCADPVVDGATGVTPSFAAIAETGSVVFLSSPGTPASLNFVPARHVAIVQASAIVPTMEHVWARFRAQGHPMPRAINVVTGPSRTADVEQVVQVGVHGPQRVHLLICDRA